MKFVVLLAVALFLSMQPIFAQATVDGTVTDDAGRPVDKVHVYLEGQQGGYNSDTPQAYTDLDGKFSINVDNFRVITSAVASPSSNLFQSDSTPLSLIGGKTKSIHLILCRSKVLTLDYCYQASGERSFSQSCRRTLILRPPQFGFLFAKGVAHDTTESDDLRLKYDNHKLSFHNFHVGRKGNGFYDAGARTFESITEAALTGYAINYAPCVVGHVYVVRTFDGHYAKFRVRSIEDAS